jgi:hypothetical protein
MILDFIRAYPGLGSFFGSIIGATITAFVVWRVAMVVTKKLKRIDSTFEFSKRYQDLLLQKRKLQKQYKTVPSPSIMDLKDDAMAWWFRYFDLNLFEFDFFCAKLVTRERFIEWTAWRQLDFQENKDVCGITYKDGWKAWSEITAMQGNPFIDFLTEVHVGKKEEVKDIVRRLAARRRAAWRLAAWRRATSRHNVLSRQPRVPTSVPSSRND